MKRKRLSASGALMMGWCFTVACGGTTAARGAAPGDQSTEETGVGGNGGEATTSGCLGARSGSGSEIVAAGIAGTDLVLVTARGEQRVAASFEPPDGGRLTVTARVMTGDGRVTASLGEQTIRLDANFRVLYRLPAFADFASDAGIVVSTQGPQHFLRVDGTSVTFTGASGPLSTYVERAPDSDGWMLASWSTATATKMTHGLLNTDGRVRPYFTEDSAAYSMARLAGQDVFLHGEEPFTLTFGSASTVIDVPMNAPSTPGPLPTYLYVAGSADVGMVTSAYDSRLFRVEGAARTVTPVDVPAEAASAVGAGTGGSVVVSADGKTFLGVDPKTRPAWTYDADAGRLHGVSLAALSPLRPLDGDYCNRPMAAVSGGGIGIGLRDDAVAGFYLVSPEGTAARIGRPLRDVIGISAVQVGPTWVITGDSGLDSYCPRFAPFTSDPLDASIVSGNSVQVVAPSADPLVFTEKDEWAMGITEVSPSGFCVFHADAAPDATGSLYDLETGSASALGTFQSFAWLPR